MNRKFSLKHLISAALIGGIYASLTIALAPISYGLLQIRVSEALTVLPYFSPYSIGGLFVGCVIANIFGGNGLLDITLGSLATLIAAVVTYYIGKSDLKYKKLLAPLPPVIVNAIVVAYILKVAFNNPLIPSMLWVGLGEAVACYFLGLPLMAVIEKNTKLKEYLRGK